MENFEEDYFVCQNYFLIFTYKNLRNMNKTNFTLEEIRKDCSELEQRILEMYLNRKKQKEMIEELGITRSKIDHFVARYRLTRFRDRNNYCLDETRIDINNPEYWYFVGFFAADGSVNLTNSGSEVIQFTQKDKEPLEDIINILNYSGEIKKYEKSGGVWFLAITNRKLVASLKEIFGEIYRKTSTMKFPDIPNDECLGMFLRGFWDGDGCLTIANDSRHYIAEAYCDSKEFLDSLEKILIDHNIKMNRFSEGKHFAINAKDEVSKFIGLLYGYNSPIGLPRKRALAMLHLYYVNHSR